MLFKTLVVNLYMHQTGFIKNLCNFCVNIHVVYSPTMYAVDNLISSLPGFRFQL